MTTDPTERALLRGIIANPAEDTPRLVYADWLDEHPGKVPCPECGDSAGVLATSLDTGEPMGWCLRCRGTGTVSDGRAERAELIRLQCELARKRTSEPPPAPTRELAEFVRDLVRLENRERELLAAHGREWARVPWGIGCAFDRLPGGQATPHFRRGFVERVEVPALSWVMERAREDCPRCEGKGWYSFRGAEFGYQIEDCENCARSGNEWSWRVTPWALAVAAAHPVTEFVIGDREPRLDWGEWGWEEHNLPEPIWNALGGEDVAWHDTREAALSALATAAADVVRAKVLEMWAKEVRT